MSLYGLVPETVLTATGQTCPEEETTLVSDSRTDGQTDKIPDNYLSVRITVKHNLVRVMLEEIFKGLEYLCYLHKGVKTQKEHVHVLVIDVTASDKLRKRLARSEYKGNQAHSIKLFNNGLCCGIQYASKEGNEPIVFGDFEYAIKSAPKWEQRQSKIDSYMSGTQKCDVKKRHWQLTYSNIVHQAVDYAKANSISHFSFKEVLQHMCEHSNWAPSNAILIHGLHEYYTNRYDHMIGNFKSGQRMDMSWFNFKG